MRGADLDTETVRAYAAYAENARRAFLDRPAAPAAGDAARLARLRAGTIIGGPGGGDGILNVPGGLVHHWSGSVFVPGISVEDAVRLSQTYARYPDIYESVKRAELVGREGDAFRVLLRIEEKAGPITAVLDVWSDVRYHPGAGGLVHSISESTEIREVVDAGRPDERRLPPGRDRGYLWRAAAYSRYTPAEGGVLVELETLGLTRGFPPLMGWVIEPIARRLGRKSVEGSLEEFRKALVE